MHIRRILLPILLLPAATALAIPVEGISIPSALQLASTWISAHPTSPDGYFFLSQVNAYAWQRGEDTTPTILPLAYRGDAHSPPNFYYPWQFLIHTRDPANKTTPAALAFLSAAINAQEKSLDLYTRDNTIDPRTLLALAYLYEDAANAALPPSATAPLTPAQQLTANTALATLADLDFPTRRRAQRDLLSLLPNAAPQLAAAPSTDAEFLAACADLFHHYWLTRAIDTYRTAYRAALPSDLESKDVSTADDSTVSLRAAQHLLQLLPPSSPEATAIQATLTPLLAKPPRPGFTG